MYDTCETVRVKSAVSDDNPTGFIVINKSDLTDEHELYQEPKAAATTAEPKAAPAAPAATQPWAAKT